LLGSGCWLLVAGCWLLVGGSGIADSPFEELVPPQREG